MKMVKDKQLLVGSDRAGFALKEAIKRQLVYEGWEVTDVGVQDPGGGITEQEFRGNPPPME